MTNFEKHYNTIKEYVKKNKLFAIINNIPANCESIDSCKTCYFYYDGNYHCHRSLDLIKWLLEENHTLTKEEHAFCEMMNTGYLVRDENGELWYSIKEPLWYSIKEPYRQCSKYVESIFFMKPEFFPQFTFISWKDEPYKIEDLLTYPVYPVETKEE